MVLINSLPNTMQSYFIFKILSPNNKSKPVTHHLLFTYTFNASIHSYSISMAQWKRREEKNDIRKSNVHNTYTRMCMYYCMVCVVQ